MYKLIKNNIDNIKIKYSIYKDKLKYKKDNEENKKVVLKN